MPESVLEKSLGGNLSKDAENELFSLVTGKKSRGFDQALFESK